ncbi:MAG TPA: HEAT repeat domain-containing protein [Kofleriaceae bacterium]|nr:HEAT repeat domain-containing protein [Kofleriaceae bacterium]
MALTTVFSACLASSCANRAKQSISFYEAGDYAGAERAADDGLKEHPDDRGLWGMRVRAALALGNGDDVAKSYAALREHEGDDDKPLLHDLAQATIEQALDSPSAKLKIRAIETIVALDMADLEQAIANLLGDRDDRVAAAASIAVLHDDPRAPQVADAMLVSESGEARRIAVDGVGRKVGKLALGDLEKAGEDPDPRVREVAVRWLGKLKDAEAVVLCTQRLHDQDDAVRAAAAEALGAIGIGDLAADAKVALADHALEVRLAGVDLLAAAHRDDLLAALVDDPDPRIALAAGLAAPRESGALAKAIARAVAAPDWTTRVAAAGALAHGLPAAQALTAARQLAADKVVAVRLAAARALVALGDAADARAVFAAALHDPDHGIQAAADLAAQGDPAGVAALSEAVRDAARSPEQRAEAATAHVAAHRVTPGLVAALADSNALVRIEAAAALGELAK